MRILPALIAILLPAVLAADDLRPDSSGVPLFQVFPLIRNASEQVSIDRDHPLLSVEAVRDFYLKNDKRRVRVVLTPDDAKAFTTILQTHEAVGITAGETTALIKSGTGFNGSLTFDNPVAAYLRHRFHVKPASNEVDPPPLNPFATPNP
jgi:hypothetical protein